VFDSYDTTRLQQWKEFRSSLETSATAFEDVALFWSRAPFVNNYLDPFDSKSWPDPWQLILNNKFDDLGITLGMCYTLQLTERFKDHEFEIHMSMSQSKKDWRYLLAIDKDIVLNWNFGSVTKFREIDSNLTKIWSK
jgi:hypothetical protein